MNWLAVGEPDFTAGPAIDHQERVLAVGTCHPLAARPSVSVEDLADYEVALLPPSFPPALYDAVIPPCAPSGRVIRRTQPVYTIHELVSLIARGRIVHRTGRLAFLRRDDIALIPITGLPPMSLGLIWRTAHETARIRALGTTGRSIYPASARGAAA